MAIISVKCTSHHVNREVYFILYTGSCALACDEERGAHRTHHELIASISRRACHTFKQKKVFATRPENLFQLRDLETTFRLFQIQMQNQFSD